MADELAPDNVTSFDKTFNYDYHDAEYDQRLGFARTMVGGSIATVVDAGTSLWNSLPGTPEVQTADLLKSISNDAVQVYAQNPDAVQAASFIAGSLVPFGLAQKGLNAARAGMKGINWFSKAGQEARLADINKLFSEAGGATTEYRDLLRAHYAKGIANQALDAAAGEFAVMGLMNSHPLMEDYFQDPVKNFALSLGLGATIGGAIGHVADRYAVRQLNGATYREAWDATVGTLRDIAPDMTLGVALQSHEINIQNLNNIISAGREAGKTTTNDLTQYLAETILTKEKERQASLFDAYLSDQKLASIPKADRDAFMQKIIQKPEMFGVDKISLLKQNEVSSQVAGLRQIDTKAGPFVGAKIESVDQAAAKLIDNLSTGDGIGKLEQKVQNLKGLTFDEKDSLTSAVAFLRFDPSSVVPKVMFDALAVAKKIGDKELGEAIWAKMHQATQLFSDDAKNYYQKELNTTHGYYQLQGTATPGNLGTKPSSLTDKPVLSKLNAKTGETEAKSSVYFSEFDKFGTVKDGFNYANAAALNKTVGELEKSLPKNYGRLPNLDSSMELIGQASADVHGQFVAARARVEKWDADQIAKAVVGESDIPLLSALVMRLRSDVNMARNVAVSISGKNEVFKAILEEVQQGAQNLGKGGVPQAYADAVEAFTKPNAITKFIPGATTGENHRLISDWIGGDQFGMQKSALAWQASRHGGYNASSMDFTSKQEAAKFAAIYDSPESQALRAEFSKIADADGNVYLYRGWKIDPTKVTGENMVASYTTDPVKAGHHGNVGLYKVHVDNIAAGWRDIKDSDGVARNEILVLTGAREVEATLSKGGTVELRKKFESGALKPDANTRKLQLGDLEDLLVEQKQKLIDEMLYQGIPMESISLKTDTPFDVVQSYAFARNQGATTLQEVLQDTTTAIKTRSMQDAEAALEMKNAPLRLEGNLKKNPYIEAHAAMNNQDMKNMSDMVIQDTMNKSKSKAVNDLGNLVYGEMREALTIMDQQIGYINNQYAGARFLSSADFYARDMGSLGPIATYMSRQIQRISNDTIGRVVNPIKDLMLAVSKDPVGIVEFNTFYNVNAGLKGWRAFLADGTIVQKQMRQGADGILTEVLEPVNYNGTIYKVQTESVKKAILGIQEQGKELLELANASRRIKGAPNVNDIGLWVPSMNPTNKYIAYVHDQVQDSTKMLFSHNEAEYAQLVRDYRKYLEDTGQSQNIRVVTKDEQADWNILNGRLDTVNMERADVGMQKTGSSQSAIVKNNLDVFGEIIGGYEHYITKNIRDLAELNMSEITGKLDRMSAVNQVLYNNQPLSAVKKFVSAPQDAAATMKNTLLGNSNLGEYGGWKAINQGFETGLSFGVNTVTNAWNTMVAPLTKGIFGKNKGLTPEAMKKADYEAMSAELEKRGVVNPWAVFDKEAANMYGVAKIEDIKDTSKRIVYASNALAATVALRIGELAQPLVNILSLPILTGLAINSKMPAEFLGKKLGTADLGVFGGTQIMYEGARAANSPLWKHLDERWAREGHYSSLVSEASDAIRMSRKFEKGLIAQTENLLDSNMVKIMSKPADWSESFVRRQTMFTGAVLAKRLYPELSDEGITIFARDFMDKAVGNFHASQRPVFFQGTMGTALGLFQTYMLTMGQSIYRNLELRNYKALGKAALTQSTIFGGASLPGFQQVSQMIGEHFSDENVDLTTGTYRALGETADLVLYGLPSNLGPSVYTRGDVSIRPPNVLAGAQNTVAVSFLQQSLATVGAVAKAMEQDGLTEKGRALVQALSMQSMSRPLARGSELLTGYSVTRQGNTVQTPEEVWTTTGIISRILATRPIQETKLREAMHLNSYYGALDRDARIAVTAKLKTAIRSDELSQETIDKLAADYMRKGGTPTGWRSALNTALAQTNVSGKEPLVDKLKPNNPLNYMLDTLEGGLN